MSKSLIYTASAAVRILKLAIKASQVRVEQWFNCVWVWVPGQLCRILSKAAFKAEFVAFRRANATALKVTRHLLTPNCFGVRNEDKGTLYTVTASQSAIACQCPDYQQQIEAFGKGACKHAYSVLNQLGYATLSDYLNSVQKSNLALES